MGCKVSICKLDVYDGRLQLQLDPAGFDAKSWALVVLLY